MDILFLILGLAAILAGANFLTDGAADLAKRFRIPEFIVGLTVVAVGTSTPELVISVLSALKGQGDMAIGNVVGSNLFNTFVILGVCALVAPLALTRENIRRDIPVGVAVALLLLACGYYGSVARPMGIAMAVLYVVLLWYAVRSAKSAVAPAPHPELSPEHAKPMWLVALMIVGGLGALVGGGEAFLHGATSVARRLGVSESVIAITLVAGGTSLPELASSVVSVVKGRAELALGNVIGSNTANILLILGVSATVRPLSMGTITLADIYMVLLGAALLFVAAFTFRRRALDRWEGAILLCIYAVYIVWLVKH